MSSPTTSRVLIIGGGIGGLALALGLKKQGIAFHVYERDRTESYRAQGYRIRIGGPAAPAIAYLLPEEARADFELAAAAFTLRDIPEIDAETGRVDEPNVDPDVRITPEQIAQGRGKAWCVDRSNFRAVMIKHLAPEDISYDKSFQRYEEAADGSVVAHFADGSTATGALLVGADGRGSKLRRQMLPQLEVLDTGIKGLYGRTPLSEELLRDIQPATVLERMSFVKDRSAPGPEIFTMGLEPILFPHRAELHARGIESPPDYLFWVLAGTRDALGLGSDEQDHRQHLSPAESEQLARDIAKRWSPGMRSIIEHQQPGETCALSITAIDSKLPVWEASAHVTALGDAVHPMAPTGSGAVTALHDAHVLARLLSEQGFGKSTVEEYERQMRETASKAVQGSWMMAQQLAGMTKNNERHVGEMAMQNRAKIIVSK